MRHGNVLTTRSSDAIVPVSTFRFYEKIRLLCLDTHSIAVIAQRTVLISAGNSLSNARCIYDNFSLFSICLDGRMNRSSHE